MFIESYGNCTKSPLGFFKVLVNKKFPIKQAIFNVKVNKVIKVAIVVVRCHVYASFLNQSTS
jgi:hypothetical protein